MKKLLVILSVAALMVGCGLVPDVQGMKDLLEKDLTVTVEPIDQGVKITAEGFPDEMPQGFDGVDIYVSEDEITLTDKGDKIVETLDSDTTIEHLGLENGADYFAGGGAEAGGEDVIHGFGGGFYPRPGGFGSFLGGSTPGEQDGIIFDRTTGVPSDMPPDETVDFYFYMEGSQVYMANAVDLGGQDINRIKDSGESADNWLEVKDADTDFEAYASSIVIEQGNVYQLILNEGENYGKIAVDSVTAVSAYYAEGMKVWLRYAFQTAKHVGHY